MGEHKLDPRVHPQTVSIRAGHFAEVLVQGVDGGEDLGVADVFFFHAQRGTAVDDVDDGGNGVEWEGIGEGQGGCGWGARRSVRRVPCRVELGMLGRVRRALLEQRDVGSVGAAGRTPMGVWPKKEAFMAMAQNRRRDTARGASLLGSMLGQLKCVNVNLA